MFDELLLVLTLVGLQSRILAIKLSEKPFLLALQELQAEFEEDQCPIRTALVTARSAPAHERVIRTLRSWGVR